MFVGLPKPALEILQRVCVDGTSLFFLDSSLSNLYKVHTVCGFAQPYKGEPLDIQVDFENDSIRIREKVFPISKIQDDAYIQGLHEFYG